LKHLLRGLDHTLMNGRHRYTEGNRFTIKKGSTSEGIKIHYVHERLLPAGQTEVKYGNIIQ